MRIALLISGGGTTMEAIIKATQDGTLINVFPVLVISSDPKVQGIEKALRLCLDQTKNIGYGKEDVIVIDPKDFTDKNKFGEKILEECKKRKVDFIGQYGWMVKTPENVCEAYKWKIINQHPGPLDTSRPDFGGVGMYGLRVHQARLEFVRRTKHDYWTEATTHYVTANFDEGKVIKRKQVPILEGDTAETLQARVLPVEHKIQIEVLHDFSNGIVIELDRENPLVLEGEEKILKECKEMAIKMYPKG